MDMVNIQASVPVGPELLLGPMQCVHDTSDPLEY
jgi:hypothetical protein